MTTDQGEPFNVEVDGQQITVFPQVDGTFFIERGDEVLGVISAEIGNSINIVWGTGDLLPKEFAQKIGEAIERYEC
jgi:hypothetical protein